MSKKSSSAFVASKTSRAEAGWFPFPFSSQRHRSSHLASVACPMLAQKFEVYSVAFMVWNGFAHELQFLGLYRTWSAAMRVAHETMRSIAQPVAEHWDTVYERSATLRQFHLRGERRGTMGRVQAHEINEVPDWVLLRLRADETAVMTESHGLRYSFRAGAPIQYFFVVLDISRDRAGRQPNRGGVWKVFHDAESARAEAIRLMEAGRWGAHPYVTQEGVHGGARFDRLDLTTIVERARLLE